MDNYAEIRKLAIELHAADNGDIIKVAGILRKIIDWLRGNRNKAYDAAWESVGNQSQEIRDTIEELTKQFSTLSSIIQNGEVDKYNAAFEEVKDSVFKFYRKLNDYNKDAKITLYYTLKEMEEPGFIEKFKQYLPQEYDVEINKQYDTPLKSFSWYENISPSNIRSIRGGADGGVIKNFVKDIVRKAYGDELISDEEVKKIPYQKVIREEIVSQLNDAIVNGTLKYVSARKPYAPPRKDKKQGEEGGLARANWGEVTLGIETAPILLNSIGLRVVGYAYVHDYRTRAAIQHQRPGTNLSIWKIIAYDVSRFAEPQLSFKDEEEPGVFPKPLPEDWEEPDVSKPEGAPPAEVESDVEKEEVEPEEKTIESSCKKPEFLKLGGADRSAWKRLSDEFWVELVKMANRLNAKPEDMAKLLYHESAFDPKAMYISNGRPVAKGLHQLTLIGAKGMGMTKSQWDNYENTDPIQQLRNIEKYMGALGKIKGVNEWDATQLYVANFAPKYVNQSDAVLYKKYKDDGSKNPSYTLNSGLDQDKKGYISVADLGKVASGPLPKHILEKIEAAKLSVGGSDLPETTTDEPMEDQSIDDLIKQLYSSYGPLERIVRKSLLEQKLPISKMVIVASSKDASYSDKLEYARVAARILRRFADASVTIYGSDCDSIVELQCSLVGEENIAKNAVKALCECVSEGMLRKVSGHIAITPILISNAKSNYNTVDMYQIVRNNRRFNLDKLVK